MAAILCQTIGELIGKCCQCMKLPCSYMGQACSKSCDMLGEVMCTPFAPYLVLTLGLNTPAVVYAIKSFNDYGCSPSLFRWLLINAAFGICHMFAAFYITGIIRSEVPGAVIAEAPITATTGLNSPRAKADVETATNFRPLNDGYDVPGEANSFQRIKHVLCYDKGMAIYILIFFTWIFWMVTGVTKRLFFDGDEEDCDEMLGYMNFSIACGYVYMSMVGVAFCCSLVCLR